MYFKFLDTAKGINSPELPEGLKWLNLPAEVGSAPISLKDLKPKVVLIDFWTYSCINCQRTLPYLKSWWEKYSNLGLVIIGVHTPEFEFEKDLNNVKKALQKYEVSWPVVLDNDYKIWNLFANRYWPAKYLINHNGKIIYTHFGEGNYQETEIKIQEALKEVGFKVSDKTVGKLLDEKVELGQTGELYLGSSRGQILPLLLKTSAEDILEDQVYIIGSWNQQKEYLEHVRQTKDLEDILVLKYKAKKVYLVMESEALDTTKVYITLDGVGLKDNGAGSDIEFDEENRAFVKVKFATLYNLIEKESFGEHILRISTTQKNLRLFAFTFGS